MKQTSVQSDAKIEKKISNLLSLLLLKHGKGRYF